MITVTGNTSHSDNFVRAQEGAYFETPVVRITNEEGYHICFQFEMLEDVIAALTGIYESRTHPSHRGKK